MEYSFLKDVIQWDIFNWSQAIRFWEKKLPRSDHPLNCLELGSRNGGLSLWLASEGNNVLCSDLSSPEDIARPLHNKYKLIGNVNYQAIDALNIPYKSEFDIITFKSILGGISRNDNNDLKFAVINQIYSALKPGGYLLFAENLDASGMHRYFRKKFTKWGGYWNYLNLDEIDQLLSAFNKYETKTAGFFAAFGQNEFQRSLLGRVDKIINNLIPDRMKYIVFVIAYKNA